ncbi:GGDEF domain-containing protein [Halomonas sp. HP20-15]|uniref:GGDEF domain-containing protein n=1 Tax=Halomonas sp. HP20-15 TaxID=3085901 RepID=UPI0029821076|nr:GGDEF domain-containing protein [Halomonas sp. HP20-15]MDW5377059.1 GGDEF domain-containing protein [Halomonas sp. HP20-15]
MSLPSASPPAGASNGAPDSTQGEPRDSGSGQLALLGERIPGLVFQLLRDTRGQLRFPLLAGDERMLQGADRQKLAQSAEPALERIARSDYIKLMSALEHSALALTTLAIQLRILRLDGATRWVTVRARPERTSDGSTLWHGVLIDVSEQVVQQRHLRKLSDTDELTGLANRRRLMQRLREEMSSARRHARPLSLLLLDLDHFKRINDTWGHLKGDQVLKQLAELCCNALRGEDLVARLGGEELAILLPCTPIEAAVQLAERLREAIAGHDFGITQGRVTASLGAAEYQDNDTIDELIERADRGLYAAKHAGRNRVLRA